MARENINIVKKVNDLIEISQEEEITLTIEQENNIISAWRNSQKADQPLKLKDLVEIAFPNMGVDGRSKQAKAVKDFLASYKVFPDTNVNKKKGEYTLTFSEQEFVQNNLTRMTTMEIAEALFPDLRGKKMALSAQYRAIRKFLQGLDYTPTVQHTNLEILSDKEKFTPPETYLQALRLINKYTYDSINQQEASERDKHGVNVLIKYLHSVRFLNIINTFISETNRELFLSEFIRTTYDKPDLTADELNLYINLCSDYVLLSQIKFEIELLNQRLSTVVDDPEGKISMSLAEMISVKTKEYNSCLSRQEILVNKLNGSRAVRLKSQASANASIASLVEYWREEKHRKKMLHIAEIKTKARLEKLADLNSMDSIKVEIFGAIDV